MAQLILTPLLIIAYRMAGSDLKALLKSSVVPLLALIPAIGVSFFTSAQSEGLSLVLVLFVPLLIWMADRGGIALVSIASILLSFSALYVTARGFGPFIAHGEPQIVDLNVFIIGLALTSQFISILIQNRKFSASLNAKNEQRLRALIDNWPEPMLLMQDNRYFEANPAAYQLLGYESKDGIINKTPSEISPISQPSGDFSWSKAHDMLALFDNGSDTIKFEWVHAKKDGTPIPIFVTLTPIKLDEKTIILCAWHDLTEAKKQEQAILEAKLIAEQSAKSKSMFLANMSHEIRTPMNGILGLSQIALMQQSTPELKSYLSKIHLSANSLLGILNEILDFSKIDAGHLVLDIKAFNLPSVFNTLNATFEDKALSKKLSFESVLDSAIPANLIGDSLRLQQVLSNLVGNAIKFTEQGTVTLKASLVALKESNAAIEFSVTDTGIGIAQEDLDKLFKPFSQVDDSSTRKFGGTGLGLAISLDLVKLMGGHIEVSSLAGQGSTFKFTVTLPLSSEIVEPTGGNLHKVEVLDLASLGKTLAGKNVLVAEDNKVNQVVVREFLTMLKINVVIANNGLEAIDILKQYNFDAVLMDVHMPEMGGVEATQHIRTNPEWKDIPIIALTAGVTQEEQSNCFEAGMVDFIPKPIEPEYMIRVLDKWLASGHANVEEHGMFEPLVTSSEVSNPVSKEDIVMPNLSEVTIDAWTPFDEALTEFNLSTMKAMLGKDPSVFKDMLQFFVDDFKDQETQILVLLESNKTEGLKALHKIKGAAGNLGALKLNKASEAFEACLKKEDASPEEIKALADSWVTCFNATYTNVVNFLASKS